MYPELSLSQMTIASNAATAGFAMGAAIAAAAITATMIAAAAAAY